MKKNNLKRFLASLLAVLMLASVTGVSPAVFADNETGTTEPTESTEPVAPVLKENTGAVEVLIKSDTDVKDALAKALLANYSELTKEQIAAIDWQYECEGSGKYNPGRLSTTPKKTAYNTAFGPIVGFTSGTTAKNNYNEDVNVTCTHPALISQKADSSFKVCIGNDHDNYREIVKVDKYSSKIVLKKNASITYNMDAANMKEQIFNNAIDWEASDLPAKETLSINDFKFEWKTLPEFTDKLPLDKDKLEGFKGFAPIEGGKRDTWLDPLDYPMMGAGDQTILIKFNGNSEFKPSDKEGALKVEKANVTVTIKDPIKIMKAGEEIDVKDYVSTDPADPALDIYIVYVGVNTNKESTIYLQVSGEKQNFIDGISDFQKK